MHRAEDNSKDPIVNIFRKMLLSKRRQTYSEVRTIKGQGCNLEILKIKCSTEEQTEFQEVSLNAVP